jgi:phage terminase large subunit GpA-like protein
MTTNDPVKAGLAEGFKPKPRLTLSQWAEEKLVLPPERSASPGPFRIGDSAYQRGMMDAMTDPDVEDVVFVTSSQVGKSTIITAAQCYYAEAEPSPQLSAWPDQLQAEAYREESFDPTVRDSKAVAARMRSRVKYVGGFIAFVGANTPTKLAAKPIRVVTGDEVDRWPVSSGKEGSPVDLAKRRRQTYLNRKGLWVSTPVHEDASQIVEMFKATRQHYFHVKCPACQAEQVLDWQNVMYEKGKEDEAEYCCTACGELWGELTKRKAVREGRWIELEKGPFKVFHTDLKPLYNQVGYWINALYSPHSSMREMARQWTEAEGNPEKEQTFYNTFLGLPYKGDISSFADPEGLIARREAYKPMIVPKMAGLLTCAADVQADRIEVLTTAWGLDEECWLLDHQVIPLDPSTQQAWDELAKLWDRTYLHDGAAKRRLKIEAATVDSGGHFTQQSYKFTNRWMRVGKRWHAHKGVPGEKKPIWVQSEQRFKDQTKLFLIGVDDAKTTVYTRYGIQTPGPGYIHLHEGITDVQCKQMTAEKALVEYVNGFPKRTWEKPRHVKNEMLDLVVYNLAVRNSLNVDLDARLRILNTPVDQIKKTPSLEEIGKMYT